MSPDEDEWGFPNRATPIGSANYYAVRFSPPGERRRNALLLGWFALIEDIARMPHDPGVARLKLDWWRGELATLDGGTPRHPLLVALDQVHLPGQLVPDMQHIVAHFEQRILVPTPADDEAFADNCRDGFGRLCTLFARLDAASTDRLPASAAAGAYCAAVETVRHAGSPPRRLPADVDADALRSAPATQRAERFERLFAHLEPVSPTQLPGLVRRLYVLAAKIHDKMRRSAYPVFDTLVDRPPVAQLWTAWRCR